MLRISKLADYATVVMCALAKRDAQVTAADLAQETHIAMPTVSKVLKILTRKGLLTSSRGAHGGYSLSQPRENIRLSQIVAALDGDVSLTECSSLHGQCELESHCSVRQNWRSISTMVGSFLNKISLQDLLSGEGSSYGDTRS